MSMVFIDRAKQAIVDVAKLKELERKAAAKGTKGAKIAAAEIGKLQAGIGQYQDYVEQLRRQLTALGVTPNDFVPAAPAAAPDTEEE